MGFWRSRAVWIWLLTLVVGVLVIARSTFTTDMSAFLPQSPSKQQQLLVDQITVGSVSRMLLMGLEGGTQEQREAASQALARQMLRQAGKHIRLAHARHPPAQRGAVLVGRGVAPKGLLRASVASISTTSILSHRPY